MIVQAKAIIQTMKKIILVVVPKDKKEPTTERRNENLGVGYLAAVLRKHEYNVDILDGNMLNINKEQLLDILLNRKTDVIGFSVRQEAIENAIWLTKELRHNGFNKTIIFGGYCPTLMTEELLNACPEVDIIVRGEGEKTLLNIMNCLKEGKSWKDLEGISYIENDKIYHGPPQTLVEDLNELPYPARDTLPFLLNSGGIPYLTTSRGCYANCSFCCIKSFYKSCNGPGYRHRSTESIISEIEYLVNNWDVKEIFISDDNLFSSSKQGDKRIEEICNEILKRKIKIKFTVVCRVDNIDKKLFRLLKKSGLKGVELGVENVNKRVLKFLRKGTKPEKNEHAIEILDNLNLNCKVDLILYDPYSTLEEIKANFNFFRNRFGKGDFTDNVKFIWYYLFGKLQIFSGVPLVEELSEKGILKKQKFHYNYNIVDSNTNRLCRMGMYMGVILTQICEVLEFIDRKLLKKRQQHFLYYRSAKRLWYRLGKIIIESYETLITINETERIDGKAIDEFVDRFYEKYIGLHHDVLKLGKIIFNNGLLPQLKFYTYKENGSSFFYDINTSSNIKIDDITYQLLNNYEQSDFNKYIAKISFQYPKKDIKNSILAIEEMKQSGMLINNFQEFEPFQKDDIKKTFHFISRFHKVQFDAKYE